MTYCLPKIYFITCQEEPFTLLPCLHQVYSLSPPLLSLSLSLSLSLFFFFFCLRFLLISKHYLSPLCFIFLFSLPIFLLVTSSSLFLPYSNSGVSLVSFPFSFYKLCFFLSSLVSLLPFSPFLRGSLSVWVELDYSFLILIQCRGGR